MRFLRRIFGGKRGRSLPAPVYSNETTIQLDEVTITLPSREEMDRRLKMQFAAWQAELARLGGVAPKSITRGDLAAVFDYSLVADQILVDAKPPKNADLPGGNGLSFDWRLVAQRRWLRPWMLAGGLRPDNVAEAIRLTNARQVDVSSGVESAPGVKDAARIADFVHAATEDGPPILR